MEVQRNKKSQYYNYNFLAHNFNHFSHNYDLVSQLNLS